MTDQENDSLEPILMVEEMQGNILGGFNKDHQGVIPLYLPQDTASISAVRRWLARFAQHVTSLSEVLSFKQEFKRRIALAGIEPVDMVACWRNIAFSYPGLIKLVPQEAIAFKDVSFQRGLPFASPSLGDPIVKGMQGEKHSWLFGGPDTIPDLLLIIAGEDPIAVEQEVNALVVETQAIGMNCPHYDIGHDLAYYNNATLHHDHGHEHFGFKDGISQPGVRGRLSSAKNHFLTPRTATSSDDPTQPEWGHAGQALICAGEFVLGYSKQDPLFPRRAIPADKLGSDPDAVAPSWARNGSYLVYRRFRQDVPAFNCFLASKARQLAQIPEFAGITAEQLGALLMGRWKSGAPLMRAPDTDNPHVGANASANNAFTYNGTLPDPQDGFPFTVRDTEGVVCPLAAHIRKVNPRDMDTVDLGQPPANLTRRILRRGIPFGRPLPPGAISDPNDEERGLLFLSYQASIHIQFELLCQNWMNQFNQPQSGTMGFDMIVGQTNQGAPPRVRSCVLKSPAGTGNSLSTQEFDPKDWIIPTGGGYFFAPSLSALSNVLGLP